jgi:hypothetical protein
LAQITATIEAWTKQASLKSDASQTPQLKTKGHEHGRVGGAKAGIDRQEGCRDFRTQDILLRMSSLEQRMERVLDIVENSFARASQIFIHSSLTRNTEHSPNKTHIKLILFTDSHNLQIRFEGDNANNLTLKSSNSSPCHCTNSEPNSVTDEEDSTEDEDDEPTDDEDSFESFDDHCEFSSTTGLKDRIVDTMKWCDAVNVSIGGSGTDENGAGDSRIEKNMNEVVEQDRSMLRVSSTLPKAI